MIEEDLERFAEIVTAPYRRHIDELTAMVMKSNQLPPLSARKRQQARDATLTPIMATTATKLGALASGVVKGTVSHPAFVDSGAQALSDGYSAAYLGGLGDSYGSDWSPTEADRKAAAAAGDAAAQAQHGFLHGFLQDILAGISAGLITARVRQYAMAGTRMYESGYRDGTVEQAGDGSDVIATWIAMGDDATCGLCAGRNGQTWTADQAPLPGDGGYGDLCEGGPNCRCVLDYKAAAESMAA